MIHGLILDKVQAALQEALIDNIVHDDPARAGAILQGPLQGNPDPDVARISVTLHENDPDLIYKPGTTMMTDNWEDEIAEVECGGSLTWKRRFTVKARCLLVNTAEGLSDTRSIAATVRKRIEDALLGISFAGVLDENEFVSKGIFSSALKGEMVQAGGPPDAYDYHIKVRFQVETTRGVTP